MVGGLNSAVRSMKVALRIEGVLSLLSWYSWSVWGVERDFLSFFCCRSTRLSALFTREIGPFLKALLSIMGTMLY